LQYQEAPWETFLGFQSFPMTITWRYNSLLLFWVGSRATPFKNLSLASSTLSHLLLQ
jgi:hypothetical protein